MKSIIVSPSLDLKKNVSGVSSVTQFIIDNNKEVEYVHFVLGKRDNKKGGWQRIPAIILKLIEWLFLLLKHPEAIIHYNFPLSKASILRDPMFMWVARVLKRKLVIHVHGGEFLSAPNVPKQIEKILQWVFGRNETVIVLSAQEEKNLQRRYNCQNIQILPNCIDLGNARTFSRSYSPSSVLHLGYLGRISHTKGMNELLSACQILKKRNVAFVLEFAGTEENGGEIIPQYEDLLGDSFRYCGVVSGQDKIDFLNRMEVFVLPSYFEGLPMSLLESMSYGCVPITTPVGSIPSVVKDGDNGLFMKDHDVDSIVESVIRLSEDRRLLQDLSGNARETIFAKFEPSVYISNLNRIYKSYF